MADEAFPRPGPVFYLGGPADGRTEDGAPTCDVWVPYGTKGWLAHYRYQEGQYHYVAHEKGARCGGQEYPGAGEVGGGAHDR